MRIALVGDHDPTVVAHRAIPIALERAATDLDLPVEAEWVGTESIGPDPAARLSGFAGVWCIPASPYRSTDGALSAIRYARESGLPFLGTCGGFQHAILEYARNVLGRGDAGHAELDPTTSFPVITPLACSLVEARGNVRFAEGSRLRAWYGAAESDEGYHCSYGLNPEFEALLSGGPLAITARDLSGEARGVELAGHPFFVATLFQLERAALAGVTPPVAREFVRAVSHRKGKPS